LSASGSRSRGEELRRWRGALGCAIATVGAALVWWRPATVVALLGLVIIEGALAGVFPALVALTPERGRGIMARHVIRLADRGGMDRRCGDLRCLRGRFPALRPEKLRPALMVVAALLIVGAVGLERASVPAGPR